MLARSRFWTKGNSSIPLAFAKSVSFQNSRTLSTYWNLRWDAAISRETRAKKSWNSYAVNQPRRRPFHTTRPMREEDLYSILGVAKGASADEIKKAYHKLALQHHPDRTKNDKSAEQKFAKINAAYEVLKDEKKRQQYDQFGAAGVDPSGFAGGFGGAEGINMEEILESIFGGGGRAGPGGARHVQSEQVGSDIEVAMQISFMDAVKGVEIPVTYPAQVTCQPCNGTGASAGSKSSTCSVCGGRGVETIQAGIFPLQTPCRACQGEGRIISSPCNKCSGHGRVRERSKTTNVRIPGGIEDGMTVRVPNAGDAGRRNAPAGHLFIRVTVGTDPVFRREKQHIHVDVPISIAQATLGGTVKVPVLDGPEVEIKVPAGLQPGEQRMLRGRGLTSTPGRGQGSKGNLFVHFRVVIPAKLTDRQKTLIEEFGKIQAEDPDFLRQMNALFPKRS